jgi:thiamine biosynthesis lipoprotein
VSIGPLLQCWRAARKAGRKPTAEELNAARARLGLDGLQGLSPGDPQAPAGAFGIRRLPGSPAVSLDFGGIGKGFALDAVREVLSDWDIDNALLQGGGSTALAIGSGVALGSQPAAGEGWPVGVGGEWGTPEGWRAVRLVNRALSGSGTAAKGRHIVDPRTGYPVAARAAAWAICKTAARADALSTAFMIMSAKEIEAYCRRHPDTWAMVVERHGDVRSFGVLPPGTQPVAGGIVPPDSR